MSNIKKIDPSSKAILIYLGIFIALVAILYIGANIILPVVIAALFASLMLPVTKWFLARGLPKWLSIGLTMLVFILFFALLGGFVSLQVEMLAEDWPEIEEKAIQKYEHSKSWMKQNLGFNPYKFAEQKSFKSIFETWGTTLFSSLSNLFAQSFLIFIYLAFFLLQKDMFKRFARKSVKENKTHVIDNIIDNAQKVSGDYLIGKTKVIGILFAMYLLGFWLGNVPYFVFLALFAAVFSVIPFLGNLVGGGAAFLLAYIYSGFSAALVVFIVVTLAQILENNVLAPWIIGDEVDLNPFITLFSVVAFTGLWGIVGAIIALPVTSVIKVIFDNVKGMEKFAYLLSKGEEQDS